MIHIQGSFIESQTVQIANGLTQVSGPFIPPWDVSSDSIQNVGYRVVRPKDSRSFWRFGRVFEMLWTEPPGPQVSPGGGTTRNGSHISTTWLNESVISEIRRFVVVQDGHDYVQCLCVSSSFSLRCYLSSLMLIHRQAGSDLLRTSHPQTKPS